MEKPEIVDDQILGTFIDGELDNANQAAIINAMETDPELRERVYRLRRARDLMRLGYGEARAPATGSRKAKLPRWSFPTRIVASIAALAISFSAGMFGYQYLSTPAGQPVLAGAAQQQSDKVILHISQSSQRQFVSALDYTEQFLRARTSSGDEIEVVAHANGLDLLREDVSPLRERIKILIQQYDNVHFIACAGAIGLLRDSGIEPRIIPGVSTDTTAFDHIVTRLQGGGWRYIKAESLPGA
jgi:intracellular sulfur oxidation DsrE/DsrF family protein